MFKVKLTFYIIQTLKEKVDPPFDNTRRNILARNKTTKL